MKKITLSKEAKNLKKGIYKHFNGKYYYVLGIAVHSETSEELVIYVALYNIHKIWVRPLNNFIELVKKDGIISPRFEYKAHYKECMKYK
ncbi:MAG: DUF1653 domain-containing protein [Endomicrobiaceae bacterium]|nr:DUF1653 domain-containing protein [Endomicrobiaceae bacterium]